MIVGLRDRVQVRLGPKVDLPATLIFDYPRPIDLAGFVVQQIQDLGKIDENTKLRMESERAPLIGPPRKTVSKPSRSVEAMTEEEALAELMRELEK